MDDEEGHPPTRDVPPLQLPSSGGLRVLFERAPEIITIVDPEGQQLMVNAAGLRLLAFEESFRRPEDGWTFVHPDDRDRLMAYRRLLDERRRRGEALDAVPAIRYRVKAGSGEWRWLETLSVDMTDVPEVGGRVAFSRDVTEAEERAQALLESRARLGALVASFRGGAFVDDADERVLLANDRLGELFGVDLGSDRAVGASTDRLLAELSRGLDDPTALDAARRGDPRAPQDLEVVTRAGRDLEIETVPICDGDARYGRLWLVHDTTTRRDEARRTRALLELEQQARRAAELHAEQLAAYDRLRNDFVAGVSHELRTPLTAIASAAELLLSDDEVGPTLRDRLAIIQRNADRLRSMIEDLLLVGRLDAGVLTLEPQVVRLAPVVEEVATAFEPLAVARHVTVRCEVGDDVTVWADARRLTEILGNLVENAVKFTDAGTQVVVSAAPAGGEVTIEVRDEGPGIPAAQRDTVFERFVRAPEADRSATPGAGLGLAIVKGLVELHGGRVVVGDSPAGGAVVGFTLPAADGDEAAR